MFLNRVGPGGAVIRPVVGLDSPYLPAAIELLQTIFPEYKHYVPYVRACALQQSPSHPATFDHVWVVEQQGKYVAFRIFSYLYARNFAHDAFVGILEPYRNQGLGSWLVEQTVAQLCADAEAFGQPPPLGYCAEIDFPDAENPAKIKLWEERLAFYRKCGSIFLNVDYYEPPMIHNVDYITPDDLDGIQPQPMQLVFHPTTPRTTLTTAELETVIEGMYLDVYRLEPDSWYVRRALDSIRVRGEE
jgi:GNAT superfamily N-acetyltransferase